MTRFAVFFPGIFFTLNRVREVKTGVLRQRSQEPEARSQEFQIQNMTFLKTSGAGMRGVFCQG